MKEAGRNKLYKVIQVTKLFIIVVLIMSMVGLFTHNVLASGTSSEPILFIHGINSSSAQDCNEYTMWGDAKRFLINDPNDPNNQPYQAHSVSGQGTDIHWTGPLITLGYYVNDTDCDASLGNPLPSGLANPTAACQSNFTSDTSSPCLADPNALQQCGVTDLTTLDDGVSIERLSCMTAWYIWDQFSSQGQSINIVDHSMGGLIVQYALAATNGQIPVNISNATFPPGPLLVDNVITFGTPFGGYPPAVAHAVCPTGFLGLDACYEGVEMQSDSAFMNELAADAAQSPQGQGGTSWTMIGSDCFLGGCDNTDEANNTSTYMQGGHKVVYTCNPVCYDHGGYLTDSSAAFDNEVKVCDGCDRNPDDSSWQYIDGMPHSLYYMLYALLGQEPVSSSGL